MKMSFLSVCDSAIEAAGAAGGIDEVRRIAEHGWPATRLVSLGTVSAKRYEYEYAYAYDILRDAAEGEARRLGLASWELLADWADASREEIELSTDSADVRRAIQARAAEIVASEASEEQS